MRIWQRNWNRNMRRKCLKCGSKGENKVRHNIFDSIPSNIVIWIMVRYRLRYMTNDWKSLLQESCQWGKLWSVWKKAIPKSEIESNRVGDKYSDKIFVTINNNSNTEVWKACIQSGHSKRHRPPELWETGHWQGIRDTWGGSAATSRTKEPGIIRQCRSRAQGRINGSIK